MKRLFLLLLLAHQIGYAQITLEETYANAGYYAFSSSWQRMMIIQLEDDGQKFAFVDNENKTVNLHHLDHTFWKSISYQSTQDVNSNFNGCTVLYMSQYLFDTDDEIEFLYSDQNGSQGVTQIVNEDGTIQFTAEGQLPLVRASVPQHQQPIYNTSEGTFMILSGGSAADGNAYVYRLPGTLAVGVEENVFMEQMLHGSLKTYPNPSANEVMVEYSVPFGTYGTLRFTDELGRVVQTVQLSGHQGTYTLDVATLGTGIYFCSLVSGVEVLATQKLVVSAKE